MVDYADFPAFDSESGYYYAVPKKHALVVGQEIQRAEVFTAENGDEETEVLELPDEFIELAEDYDVSCRILALRMSLDEWDGYFDIPSYNDKLVSSGSREWLVVTDEEADELWDQDLENYLDECVLGELPERYRWYFDREKWKHDARMDGRAHSLSRYDGNEDCIHIEGGETYYIYRQN